jgi:hypothetical protein
MPLSPDLRAAIPTESFEGLAEKFAGVDFGKLGFTPRMRKEEFLDALWKISGFKARNFNFNRLCNKIVALLRQDDDSERMMKVIHFWIYYALLDLTSRDGKLVDGDVLGAAGEISGIYETIFKRDTTLAGINLGRFANIQLAVLDEGNVAVKVFDAVSVDDAKEIVTVFEFKFTLTLRKLYQQVIGIDSAKLPHLAVLRKHSEFKRVRNLVYFGEVGDEHLTGAIRGYLLDNPGLTRRVRITNGGFSIKLSLPEVSEFLCDPKTVSQAQQIGKPFISSDPTSAEYGSRIARIRNTVGETIKRLHARGTSKFDVIIAVSNTETGAGPDQII